MNIPPLPLLDGDTFLIDNSRLENYTNCARKGQYTILHKRTSSYEKAALNFGRALHGAKQIRYILSGSGPASLYTQAKQLVFLDKWWELEPTPFDDYRSLGLAKDTVRNYNKNYGEEPFQLFKKPDGSYLVEEPFAVPLGTVVMNTGSPPEGDWSANKKIIKVVWTGRIDLPVMVSTDVWIMDHKTAGRANDMREAQTSSALKGYGYAHWKRFGVMPRGGIINQIVAKKPTKTKVTCPNEFNRQSFEFSEEIMEEWRINTLAVVSDLLRDHARGLFPMHTKNCRGVYGLCEFHNVCSLSPSLRSNALAGDEFKDDDWDPQREGPLDPVKYAAIPDNDPRLLSYLTETPTRTKQTDVANLDMSELL